MRSLETPCLILRPWQEEDLPNYLELFSDPEVSRYMRPVTPERVIAFAAHHLRQWDEEGFGAFAALDRGTGAWIGQIGLNRLTDWPDPDNVEVGFELKRPFWGQGLATEGARACLQFGFDDIGLGRIISVTNPANWRSRRVMEKARLTFQGLREYPHGLQSVWYAANRASWSLGAPNETGL
jgi:ribosomal-protein-alanine N-acetyltransferase